MPRSSAVVTDAELSVLNHLWAHGPSVVRDISEARYQQNTPAYHATLNSLLEQLENKGLVSRDRTGFVHRFTPLVDRDDVVSTRVQQIADSHFGEALAPMLLPLADKIKLSQRDRDAIQKIIDPGRRASRVETVGEFPRKGTGPETGGHRRGRRAQPGSCQDNPKRHRQG